MFDLVKKEKRGLKEYSFTEPVPSEGNTLKITATHSGQVVGSLTFAAKPTLRPGHAYDGYHKIGKADVHPYHRGNGVYGKMLQLAAAHVKKMNSKGLVSPGEWREDAATRAWERLASKVKTVKKRPGLEPDNPDFFLSEKEAEGLDSESSPENIEHEWFVEFMRWLAERQAPLAKMAVLDPNQGYRISHQQHSDGSGFTVQCHTRDGVEVGRASIKIRNRKLGKPTDPFLHTEGIHVDDAHRRRGIASGMYSYIEGITGLKVAPSANQTPAGKALWAGNEQIKQFGKSEDLQSLIGRNLPVIHSRADEEIAVLMSGASPLLSPEFKAAKFLANGKSVSEEDVRSSLVLYDHDFELAALHAYGLPRNKQFVEMLRAVMKTGSAELSKSDIDVAALPRSFTAVMPDAKDVAEALQRSASAGVVKSIRLGGKHSKGTALATDPKTRRRWLLKPGSGQLSPARGVRQEAASQSRREVAFYKIAELAGIQDSLPEAYLVDVDGVEVAVLELLSTEYQSLDKARRKMGIDPRKIFEPYRKDGSLYRWAALDWILGSADRHGNNVMVNPKTGDVKLIDHGTTFAGTDFDPALDLKKSFIPFYLRAWSHFNFTSLNPKDRAAQMPTMDQETTTKFGQWIEDLPEGKFRQIMEQYGINPEPSLVRLRDLKSAKPELRAQRLIGLWAGTLRPQSQVMKGVT